MLLKNIVTGFGMFFLFYNNVVLLYTFLVNIKSMNFRNYSKYSLVDYKCDMSCFPNFKSLIFVLKY